MLHLTSSVLSVQYLFTDDSGIISVASDKMMLSVVHLLFDSSGTLSVVSVLSALAFAACCTVRLVSAGWRRQDGYPQCSIS